MSHPRRAEHFASADGGRHNRRPRSARVLRLAGGLAVRLDPANDGLSNLDGAILLDEVRALDREFGLIGPSAAKFAL